VPCPASRSPSAPPTEPLPANPPFPYQCGVYMMHSAANKMMEAGSRDTTMTLIGGFLGTMGPLGKPVVDRTGLTGTYDFTVTFSPDATRAANAGRSDPEAPGVAFMDAVREQLGIKLESSKAPVQMLVIDHIERPSEN
jgi:bla regulator protein blaR1